MPIYYKHGKLTTAFNVIEIDQTASYNPSTALTATFAIDQADGAVDFVERPIYKEQRRGHLATKQYLVGYELGEIEYPNHPLKTALWLQFGAFTCTTATTTHELTDLSTGAYEFALHGAQMHTTTAQNLVKDALGCKMKRIHLEWGNNIPLTAAYSMNFSELVDGNSTARKTAFDAKEAFVAGQVSYNHVYNSTSFGVTILGGSIDIELIHKYNKGGSKFPSEAIYMGKNFTVNLQFKAFNKALFDIPNNPGSYASAITFDVKFWRSSKDKDFIRCSFTNLFREMPIAIKKIDEGEYIYQGTAIFKNTGTTQGNLTIKYADPALTAAAVDM